MTVTLYHNALSTCSQKVRLALAEKAVAFASCEIDLLAGAQRGADYLAINPAGVVPWLMVAGAGIGESSVISEYIDDAFAGPALRPADPLARARMRHWMRRIDDRIHTACGVLTLATVMRAMQLQRPRADVLADIAATPDAAMRAGRLSLYEHGLDAPEFAAALQALLAFLRAADADLAGSEWLSGDGFGLADCAAAPYVIRLDHMGLCRLWAGGGLPRLQHWFERVQARPSYAVAITGWAVPARVQMLRVAGDMVWAQLQHPDFKPLLEGMI
jgi:glutathione S-transferase